MSEISIKALEQILISELGEISGTDSDDRIYDSIQDVWSFELNNGDKKKKKKNKSKDTSESSDGSNEWYSTAFQYWEDESNCPLSDDGVLGGFGKVTDVDVRDSNLFLGAILSISPYL